MQNLVIKYAKLRRSYHSFFEKLAEMSIFGLKSAFLDLNWPKTSQTGFFGRVRKCHFRGIRKPQLCAKFQKIPINEF